jgi:hypothetical protein
MSRLVLMVEKRSSLCLPWPEVWAHLKQALSEGGLELMQSFDLQSARAALSEPDQCPCPYHGTSSCSCQYMVWLVRRECGPLLSLAVHGHDDRTYISMTRQGEERVEDEVEAMVTKALNRMAPILDHPPS